MAGRRRFLKRRGVLFGALFVVGMALAMTASAISVSAAEEGDAEWKAPSRAARKKNPREANDESVAAGKKVFQKECASCHGDSGEGDGAAAKDLAVKPKDLTGEHVSGQSDGALYWKITEGRAPMTAFKTLLTDDERWDVVNYIRTLLETKEASEGAEEAESPESKAKDVE